MKTAIGGFLKGLDEHLSKFDKKVYPDELKGKILAYTEHFETLQDNIDELKKGFGEDDSRIKRKTI